MASQFRELHYRNTGRRPLLWGIMEACSPSLFQIQEVALRVGLQPFLCIDSGALAVISAAQVPLRFGDHARIGEAVIPIRYTSVDTSGRRPHHGLLRRLSE